MHASRFSRALIDLMRTAGGDAVAFSQMALTSSSLTLSLNM